MKPLSEHKRINQFLRNEFVSQRISAVKRASLKAKLSIARLTWPTENSHPTISRSRPQTIETIIGNKAHKPVTSERVCLKTDISCQKSIYPGEAQYFKTNPAKRKQPTNNFLLEGSKEPLSKNIRNNQEIQNEFVSQKIIYPGEAQYFKTNPAKRKQPTNNFLLEDSKEPLSKNIRNNQEIQNEFVSQSITGFTRARV